MNRRSTLICRLGKNFHFVLSEQSTTNRDKASNVSLNLSGWTNHVSGPAPDVNLKNTREAIHSSRSISTIPPNRKLYRMKKKRQPHDLHSHTSPVLHVFACSSLRLSLSHNGVADAKDRVNHSHPTENKPLIYGYATRWIYLRVPFFCCINGASYRCR